MRNCIKFVAVLTLQLSKGSFTLQIKSKHHGAISEHDCAQTQSSSGDYAITGGTGCYAHLGGWVCDRQCLSRRGGFGGDACLPAGSPGTISATGM